MDQIETKTVQQLESFYNAKSLDSMFNIPRKIKIVDFEDVFYQDEHFQDKLQFSVYKNNLKNFDGFPELLDSEMNPINTQYIRFRASHNSITSLSGLPESLDSLHLTRNDTLTAFDSCPLLGHGLYVNECRNLRSIDTIRNKKIYALNVSHTLVSDLPIETVYYLNLQHCKNINDNVLSLIKYIGVLVLSPDQLAKFGMMLLHSMKHEERKIEKFIFGLNFKPIEETLCCSVDDWEKLSQSVTCPDLEMTLKYNG